MTRPPDDSPRLRAPADIRRSEERLLGLVLLAAPLVATFLLSAPPGTSSTQIPDEFQNLQVFPEDIGRRELLGNMRNFSFALGVRCEYCHVGEGNDLSKFDFVSDEKPTKRTARLMLRMVREINTSHLPQLTELGKDPEALLDVRCVTCHRGQARPVMIEEVLAEVLEKQGRDAAIARYRELRDRHYGDFTFDFSETSIREFGLSLVERDRVEDGIAFLQLTIEYSPESFTAYYYLGHAYEELGERDRAIDAYERVLELRPGHQGAGARLQAIR